ncbi:MAG TPA: type II toxin-antitoxin system RelE/ParE family toxin [Hyphomicrobiaceae bacterium]|nr:type II toxin-antitoxin system RelE/ParE family toxin [Hyphomicrobiaceae bacterium]
MDYEGPVHPVAVWEYNAVLHYIGARSTLGAESVQRRIDKVISDLEQLPYIGTPTRREGVRMLVATPYPYLVYYRVEESSGDVVILDIRHGARDRDG